MLCVLLISPKWLGGKCLGSKFLHRVNASAPASTWMVRYAISSTQPQPQWEQGSDRMSRRSPSCSRSRSGSGGRDRRRIIIISNYYSNSNNHSTSIPRQIKFCLSLVCVRWVSSSIPPPPYLSSSPPHPHSIAASSSSSSSSISPCLSC